MKFEINVNTNTDKKIINAMAEIVGVYTDKNKDMLYSEAERELFNTTGKINGSAFNTAYVADETNVHFEANIDDDAIIMFLPTAVKIAKMLKPVYDAGKALVSLINSVRNTAKETLLDYSKTFNAKFGKKAKYAVLTIYSAELELADAIVVEDDGFNDEHRIIHVFHCWKSYDFDVVTQLYKAKYDSTAIFSEISEEEAVREMREMVPAIRADVNGMTRQNKKNEE